MAQKQYLEVNSLNINDIIGKITLIIAPAKSGKTDACRKIIKVLQQNHNFETGLIIGKNSKEFDLSAENITFTTDLNINLINSFCQKQKYIFESTKNKSFLILDNCLDNNVWTNHSILKNCIDNNISSNVTFVITMDHPIPFPSGLKERINYIMISGQFNQKDKEQVYKTFNFTKEMIDAYHSNAYRYYYFVFTPHYNYNCYWFISRTGYFHSFRGYMFGMK